MTFDVLGQKTISAIYQTLDLSEKIQNIEGPNSVFFHDRNFYYLISNVRDCKQFQCQMHTICLQL